MTYDEFKAHCRKYHPIEDYASAAKMCTELAARQFERRATNRPISATTQERTIMETSKGNSPSTAAEAAALLKESGYIEGTYRRPYQSVSRPVWMLSDECPSALPGEPKPLRECFELQADGWLLHPRDAEDAALRGYSSLPPAA